MGNIEEDPLIVGEDDYHLLEGSPCIDAGDPSPSQNDACFPPSTGDVRADMGAYGGRGACEWLFCWDLDDDGHMGESCGGDDCDDTNPCVSPTHKEVRFNGIDDDCDGRIDEICFVRMVIN